MNDQIYINLGTTYQTTSIDKIAEQGSFNISPSTSNKPSKRIHLSVNFFKRLRKNTPNYLIVEEINLNLDKLKLKKTSDQILRTNNNKDFKSPYDSKLFRAKINNEEKDLKKFALLYAQNFDKF